MDKDVIKQISDIARIRLTDEELDSLSKEMETLLSYFSKVQEINIEEVGEKSGYMHDLKSTLREDEVKDQDEQTKEAIRSEFTKREENTLIAPKSLK